MSFELGVVSIVPAAKRFPPVLAGPAAAITSATWGFARLLRRTGLDELVGHEGGQVVGLFADADVFDRQADLLADGDDDAALGRAVELGQDDAGAVDGLGKLCRLADAVLAGGGVEHQQHFVRGVGNLLADRRGGSWSAAAIRFCCVCSRPAVSTMHTSAPVSMACATARWATLAGSLPCSPCDDLARPADRPRW